MLLSLACVFSGGSVTPLPTTTVPVETQQETVPLPSPSPTLKVVLTNTPKSYPSTLQSWIVGDWQAVNSGEVYSFTADLRFVHKSAGGQDLGAYRFDSEDVLIFPWQAQTVQVTIWQLDANSMLLNFPNDTGLKFIRIAY